MRKFRKHIEETELDNKDIAFIQVSTCSQNSFPSFPAGKSPTKIAQNIAIFQKARRNNEQSAPRRRVTYRSGRLEMVADIITGQTHEGICKSPAERPSLLARLIKRLGGITWVSIRREWKLCLCPRDPPSRACVNSAALTIQIRVSLIFQRPPLFLRARAFFSSSLATISFTAAVTMRRFIYCQAGSFHFRHFFLGDIFHAPMANFDIFAILATFGTQSSLSVFLRRN